jgi:hypothetical protein
VLVVLSVGAFALLGCCIAGLGAAGSSPEGMLTFALLVVGAMLLVGGLALLVPGLVLLLRRVRVGPTWLVDPDDPALARWWDGQAWTDRTSPRSQRTVALAPLVSSSRRRHGIGAALLVGGVLVAVGSRWLAEATVVPVTTVDQPTNGLSMLAIQLVVPSLCAAVVGLYLVLTLADDVRPGWYRDPLDPAQLRWWDGLAWSDTTQPVRPAGVNGTGGASGPS